MLTMTVATGLLGGMWAAPAGATPAADWVAGARASAVDFGIVTTGGFIVDHIDPSGALAVSQLETATEAATSLASAPYPSEIGEQGPGLVYGAAQNTLPYNGVPVPALGQAPAWPFTVRSSANGTDPTSAAAGNDSGPFGLKTESHDKMTTGQASAGGSAPGAFAFMHHSALSRADATQPDAATVRAVAAVENLTVGDVVRIGQVRTELDLTRKAGAKEPEVAVHRVVDGLSVAGVAADLRPEGLFVKDTGAPLPPQALQALQAAGIQLGVGEQREANGSVKASGVVIRRLFDFGGTTMTTELALGVVSGTVTEVGAEAGTLAPPPPAAAVAGRPAKSSAAPAATSAIAARPVAAAPALAPAPAARPGAVGGPGEVWARPALHLAAETSPPGGAARKSMGWPGRVAEMGAILAVAVLVAARARRVVEAR